MATIWEVSTRDELRRRFARLKPETRPGWGKMSAGQMVRHCTVAMDMMTGAATVAPKPGPFRNPVMRYLIVHVLPWPKGAPTAPELIMPEYKGAWTSDIAALGKSLESIATRGPEGSFEEHPAFGRLSSKSLGVLVWRHLDHHLRQFGL
jgi:hypothetical protein